MIQQAPVGLWREAHQQVQIAVRAEILTQGGAEQAQLRDLPAAAKFLQPLVRDGNLLPAHRVSLPAGIIPSSPSGNGGTGWAQIWSHRPKRRSRAQHPGPAYRDENLWDNWSGRVDSNHRPPGPEPGALARLSHAPMHTQYNIRLKNRLPQPGGWACNHEISSPHLS